MTALTKHSKSASPAKIAVGAGVGLLALIGAMSVIGSISGLLFYALFAGLGFVGTRYAIRRRRFKFLPVGLALLAVPFLAVTGIGLGVGVLALLAIGTAGATMVGRKVDRDLDKANPMRALRS